MKFAQKRTTFCSSKEIFEGWLLGYHPLIIRNGFENFKILFEIRVHGHYGSNVPASVTIVRSRPHSHQLFVKHKLVALLDQLMCTGNKLELVSPQEVRSSTPSKKTSSATRRGLPKINVLGVRPAGHREGRQRAPPCSCPEYEFGLPREWRDLALRAHKGFSHQRRQQC